MKTVSALILEKEDFTKDLNLKSEAFEAICNADLVIHQGRVIKDRHDSLVLGEAEKDPVPAQEAPATRRRGPRVTPIQVVDAPPETETPGSSEEVVDPDGEDDTPAWALPPVNGPVV